MPKTLRRSCASCAKVKVRCSLNTPKCLRCVKRNCSCLYANEPLTSDPAGWEVVEATKVFRSSPHSAPLNPVFNSDILEMPTSLDGHLFDPFDSYPETGLPRLRVQGLMQHFLTKIAFQYYPLDLNPDSNPFVVSWWPLSLHDPLLFHVTLQTASWDDEMLARRGFAHSELLLRDSVSLLRQKVEDESRAYQDATMNAVITLAAIEHGKGNLHISKMHIDGVKRMVNVRGGLTEIKKTCPLTARMVPWVSLLVTGSPQFRAQDDSGMGDGVSIIEKWQHDIPIDRGAGLFDLNGLGIDPNVEMTLNKLRFIFSEQPVMGNADSVSVTEFHDLTSWTLHRLLSLHPFTSSNPLSASTSECLRVGVALHFLTVHGPTYYSHAEILHSLISQIQQPLALLTLLATPNPFTLWVLSVGAAAAIGTAESEWFRERLSTIYTKLGILGKDDFQAQLKKVLWLGTRSALLFQQLWDMMLHIDPFISNDYRK